MRKIVQKVYFVKFSQNHSIDLNNVGVYDPYPHFVFWSQ